jgi:hypothetical protein
MSVSRVHYCTGQESVVLGEQEPPAKKCRCRKFISLAAATKLVKSGEASWIVIERKRGTQEVTCSLCKADPEVKKCAQCGGTGKQTVNFTDNIPGTDIVYTSSESVDLDEKKKRKWLAPKTPRVATIESEHIELAYVEGVKEAAERIEEYGRLILDARCFVGKDRIPCIKPEPANNRATGQGRDYDYGRAI